MNATIDHMDTASPEFAELKNRLKTTWMTGDYDTFSRFMEADANRFFQHLGVVEGSRVLDVGCGAGQLALIAARAGATVHGCDIATNWLDKARARAAAENLDVSFEEGDAEALPYADAEFDVVASLIGAMFAPRPDLVAAELVRVCRPGGKIAMANWTPSGFVGQMFRTISGFIAPSGVPSPVLWGDEDTVRTRFRQGIADLELTRRDYHFDYPFPPADVVEFYRVNYGPVARAFASLDESGRSRLRAELVRLWTLHNRATDGTTRVDAEYLEVIATRRRAPRRRTHIITTHELEVLMSHRAETLAGRIEEGAAALAEFAEGLSDAEWTTRVVEGGSPGRSVGVVVRHVAAVYPIEIDLARSIASGKAVTEVTWEAVADLNQGHAREHADVTKADALALLKKNSHDAAEAVRTFSDEELDTAAPFSLSYGAPVTAQFVIEDHALRHSWHHLAKIRKALGSQNRERQRAGEPSAETAVVFNRALATTRPLAGARGSDRRAPRNSRLFHFDHAS